MEEINKNRNEGCEDPKPFIPHVPGSFEADVLEKDQPNPESNPNYSYMPAVAYPDGIPCFTMELQ